jgi:hypothetical protein
MISQENFSHHSNVLNEEMFFQIVVYLAGGPFWEKREREIESRKWTGR